MLTSALSAGKHGVRAWSQSLAKEFGKENIHVAHVSASTFFLSDTSADMDVECSPYSMEVEAILFSFLFAVG